MLRRYIPHLADYNCFFYLILYLSKFAVLMDRGDSFCNSIASFGLSYLHPNMSKLIGTT